MLGCLADPTNAFVHGRYLFTFVFIFELALNMISFWFTLFWQSSWNVFDAVIVFASILNLVPGMDSVPGLGQLKLLKPLRIFRLFKRVPSLKRLLAALAAAVPGVSNACLVLVIVMSIFSIIGVEIFRDSSNSQCTDHFADFGTAMFTLFVVMTGDSWSSARAAPCVEGRGPRPAYPFFILYVCPSSESLHVVDLLLV